MVSVATGKGCYTFLEEVLMKTPGGEQASAGAEATGPEPGRLEHSQPRSTLTE